MGVRGGHLFKNFPRGWSLEGGGGGQVKCTKDMNLQMHKRKRRGKNGNVERATGGGIHGGGGLQERIENSGRFGKPPQDCWMAGGHSPHKGKRATRRHHRGEKGMGGQAEEDCPARRSGHSLITNESSPTPITGD